MPRKGATFPQGYLPLLLLMGHRYSPRVMSSSIDVGGSQSNERSTGPFVTKIPVAGEIGCYPEDVSAVQETDS